MSDYAGVKAIIELHLTVRDAIFKVNIGGDRSNIDGNFGESQIMGGQ